MSLSVECRARLDAVAVDSEVLARWPDYRVLAMLAEGIHRPAAGGNGGDDSPLARAEQAVRGAGISDRTANPHVANWMAAYSAFGAKPKRANPSVLALLKRIDGGLPRIDPLTDLYNAVSIAHLLPIGGEDLDAYEGAPRLVIARGDEPFDTVDGGQPVVDHPAPGEVIWRDDVGVTCRRWNWRQGVRTRIGDDSRTVLFLLEALDPMTDAKLAAAGEALITGLTALSPSVAVESRMIGAR